MHIAPLGSTAPNIGSPAPGAASATAAAAHSGATASGVARRTIASPLPRGKLRALDPALNRSIGGAQQALAFLNEGSARLQQLKSGLSQRLASADKPLDAPVLGRQIAAFDQLWRSRRGATAGTVNSHLRYDAAGLARQHFSIRGLDLHTLRQGDGEVLFVMAGAQRITSLPIDPSIGEQAQLRRLDLALGTIGIRAAKTAEDALVFSTGEAAWPEIRDSLMIRGNGKRFPTGQFSRVQAEPIADIVQPRDWSLADTDAVRRTLHDVVGALDSFLQARETAARALAETGARIPSGADPKAEAEWASGFAERFAEAASRPGYARFAAVAPAVAAISRERVQALLSQT